MFRADSWKGWSFALVLCCGSAAAGDLRIEHVTIVSPERAAPMRDATVVIRGDRITAISRSDFSAARGKDVEVIDGTGLYLSPGLIDSHVHTGGVPACLEGRKCRPRGYQPGETENVPPVSAFCGYSAVGAGPKLLIGYTRLGNLLCCTPDICHHLRSIDLPVLIR